MKNQNDLILSIVFAVLGVIAAIVFYATAPQVTAPAAPTPVPVDNPKLPAGDVSFANALPGGSGGAGGSMAGNFGPPGGFGGGAMGVMGGAARRAGGGGKGGGAASASAD